MLMEAAKAAWDAGKEAVASRPLQAHHGNSAALLDDGIAIV
jgi:hypothetical protein